MIDEDTSPDSALPEPNRIYFLSTPYNLSGAGQQLMDALAEADAGEGVQCALKIGRDLGVIRRDKTEADLLDAYPRLTRADTLREAALAYAADTLAHETIVLQPA